MLKKITTEWLMEDPNSDFAYKFIENENGVLVKRTLKVGGNWYHPFLTEIWDNETLRFYPADMETYGGHIVDYDRALMKINRYLESTK